MKAPAYQEMIYCWQLYLNHFEFKYFHNSNGLILSKYLLLYNNLKNPLYISILFYNSLILSFIGSSK